MGRVFGFLALIATVAVGLYVYSRQVESLTPGSRSPLTAVDTTAVRNDLIGIANAERRYWISNSRYASLEELRANGDAIPTRATYVYSAEATETDFRIVATYSGPDPKAPKRLTIDQTMTFASE
jgi:hypothetical protein